MQLRCGHARAPVDRARSVHAWLRAALLACAFASLPLPALASANQAKAGAEPSGEAQVGEVLRDPDFGVTTAQQGMPRPVYRKSVVVGKREEGHVDIGGRRCIK